MGSWFSNFHVRKKDGITEAVIADCILKRMEAMEYHRVMSKEDADAVVAIFAYDHSSWISVCSDAFAHDDPFDLFQQGDLSPGIDRQRSRCYRQGSL